MKDTICNERPACGTSKHRRCVPSDNNVPLCLLGVLEFKLHKGSLIQPTEAMSSVDFGCRGRAVQSAYRTQSCVDVIVKKKSVSTQLELCFNFFPLKIKRILSIL